MQITTRNTATPRRYTNRPHSAHSIFTQPCFSPDSIPMAISPLRIFTTSLPPRAVFPFARPSGQRGRREPEASGGQGPERSASPMPKGIARRARQAGQGPRLPRASACGAEGPSAIVKVERRPEGPSNTLTSARGARILSRSAAEESSPIWGGLGGDLSPPQAFFPDLFDFSNFGGLVNYPRPPRSTLFSLSCSTWNTRMALTILGLRSLLGAPPFGGGGWAGPSPEPSGARSWRGQASRMPDRA